MKNLVSWHLLLNPEDDSARPILGFWKKTNQTSEGNEWTILLIYAQFA